MVMNRLFVLLFLLAPIAAHAQAPWLSGASKADDLHIKLVTFGPGDDIPSWWGHGGIIVEDSALQIARIYNFGLYSFDRTMLPKFVMGRLIFSVGDFSVPGYLRYYENMNRDVRIQTLNLPPAKRREMALALAEHALPENRDYWYDHYYDNCSTRPRDILDQSVNGALFEATDKPARMTLRDHTRRYVAHNPFMEMLLMFLMNKEIDQPIRQWDEMFLPIELERRADELHYRDEEGNRQPLVTEKTVYFQARRKPLPEQVPLHWPGALMAAIIIGLVAFALLLWRRNAAHSWPQTLYAVYSTTIGLLLGVPGLLLALVASFTEHSVTYYNENLLLANPLTFMLIPVGIALALQKTWAWKWLTYIWYIHFFLALLALLFKALPFFEQDNFLVLAFFVPLHALNALAVRLVPLEKSIP